MSAVALIRSLLYPAMSHWPRHSSNNLIGNNSGPWPGASIVCTLQVLLLSPGDQYSTTRETYIAGN